MKKLRLIIGDTEIHYDKNYGIDKRTGWSVSYKGSFICELMPLRWMLFNYWWFRLMLSATNEWHTYKYDNHTEDIDE